jgi:hypothetical protein
VAAKMIVSLVEHGVQTDVRADMPFAGFEPRSVDEYARGLRGGCPGYVLSSEGRAA